MIFFSWFFEVGTICFVCIAEFPFEFRALEVVLEAICSFLDARTRELETDVYPALDELTSKVKRFFFASAEISDLMLVCCPQFKRLHSCPCI